MEEQTDPPPPPPDEKHDNVRQLFKASNPKLFTLTDLILLPQLSILFGLSAELMMKEQTDPPPPPEEEHDNVRFSGSRFTTSTTVIDLFGLSAELMMKEQTDRPPPPPEEKHDNVGC
ncbi:hypothetical protein CDAR_276001 [Caerostris darwini]|uniref:Uncharacterized protein n=1 Tax=Caerostris darwini TaxID=1538125 RepID=A0AAV4QMM8_9ARAC|nr:hypothetical protein CDAR_276001 [Caerostris darwini]